MKISARTQLGLRFTEKANKVSFLQLMQDYLQNELGLTESVLQKLTERYNRGGEILQRIESGQEVTLNDEEYEFYMQTSSEIPTHSGQKAVREKVMGAINTSNHNMILINDEGTKYFYICESVYKAAELIRIGENFSGRTLATVKDGHYTYLMGRHRMARFVKNNQVILGMYYDEEKKVAFEWGIEMEEGGYFFSHNRTKEFSVVMQVLAFIELGDTNVKYLEAGRNNGGKKNVDKITNDSVKNVYVVDSNWNTLVIRTNGFAVRGHFRLQACGEGLKDRKLIWIDAFEKHGYKRKPTGEIVH